MFNNPKCRIKLEDGRLRTEKDFIGILTDMFGAKIHKNSNLPFSIYKNQLLCYKNYPIGKFSRYALLFNKSVAVAGEVLEVFELPQNNSTSANNPSEIVEDATDNHVLKRIARADGSLVISRDRINIYNHTSDLVGTCGSSHFQYSEDGLMMNLGSLFYIELRTRRIFCLDGAFDWSNYLGCTYIDEQLELYGNLCADTQENDNGKESHIISSSLSCKECVISDIEEKMKNKKFIGSERDLTRLDNYLAGVSLNNTFCTIKYDFQDNKMNSKITYSENSNPILICADICVYRNYQKISNVEKVHKEMINGSNCLVLVSETMVYLLYKDYVAVKQLRGIFYDLDMDKFQLFLLESSKSYYDLYLAVCMFLDISIKIENTDILEKFLFELFLFTDRGEQLIQRLEKSLEYHKIIYNLFRMVDDHNKEILQKYVEIIEDVDLLKIILIYFPKEIDTFIKICIRDGREFEIEELIEHYRGTEIMDNFAFSLLENNCFYLFSLCKPEYAKEFSDIIEVEKCNTKAQKNLYLSLRRNPAG